MEGLQEVVRQPHTHCWGILAWRTLEILKVVWETRGRASWSQFSSPRLLGVDQKKEVTILSNELCQEMITSTQRTKLAENRVQKSFFVHNKKLNRCFALGSCLKVGENHMSSCRLKLLEKYLTNKKPLVYFVCVLQDLLSCRSAWGKSPHIGYHRDM